MKVLTLLVLGLISPSLAMSYEVQLKEYALSKCYRLPDLAEEGVRYYQYGAGWGAEYEYVYMIRQQSLVVVYDRYYEKVYDREIPHDRMETKRFHSGPFGVGTKEAAFKIMDESFLRFRAPLKAFECDSP